MNQVRLDDVSAANLPGFVNSANIPSALNRVLVWSVLDNGVTYPRDEMVMAVPASMGWGVGEEDRAAAKMIQTNRL